MTTRTQCIIAVCKGGTRYNQTEELVDSVINYMSDVCMYNKEWYTEGQIERILKEAFYDFIDTCDKPSYFLRQLDDLISIDQHLSNRICMVFSTTDVYEDCLYINGFNADYKKIVETLQ